MAAKPKLSHEQWAAVRTAWEADPRKALPWLIQELYLPVSAEALRLRAKREQWEKVGVGASTAKLAAVNPKLAKLSKSKFKSEITSIKEDGVKTDGGRLIATEERFVSEFLIDLNATAAYKRVFPNVTDGSAATLGARLLRKVHISAAVEKAKAERAIRTEITADRALSEVWAIVTADARDLVQVKVGCCRHCHGEGHKAQRTMTEMNVAKEAWSAKGKDLSEFDEAGGIGFNSLLPPNIGCPECGGDGRSRAVIMDTRNLSPQAAVLYAGAKQTKYGIEVMMHNKADALDKVFKHLGLYEKDKDVNINVFPPKEVLDAIYTKALGEAAEMEKVLIGRRERLGITFENGEIDE